MPLYEYACSKCGEVTEVMQKMSDPPPAVCPSCGAKKKLERVISRSSFQLKGGGWYSEGYSSSSGGKKESATSAAAKTEAKSETKAESKPAATPEKKKAKAD